ncbi:hypothetical protein GCM10023168_34280 [Fodinibacter luteus]|uniref:Alpha/beta hydrolase family protein n=1 Tax=Fodinibacter luteus TaxID=552064 RepID=A0ABP8KPA8_9MICO
MTGVGVRSASLHAAAARVAELADELRAESSRLAVALGRAGVPPLREGTRWAVVLAWGRAEAGALAVVGPAGTWGHALALDALALRLRVAAAAYEEVEAAVSAVLAGVGRGVHLAAHGGWLTEVGGVARVTAVEPTLELGAVGGGPDVDGAARVDGAAGAEGAVGLEGSLGSGGAVGLEKAVGHEGSLGFDKAVGFDGAAALVAAGRGLDGGRVRVVEVSRGDGGSAWVVVVPGTQEWSPRAGSNPFDLTTDLRAMTGYPTVAAAGVTAALSAARSSSGRSSTTDPVLLVGHSQGGILAAALAGDVAFARHHRVTHVLTTGAPVGLFPVPRQVRVLAVEHGADPVPRLDLTPNPSHASWVTVRTPATGAVLDVADHRLDAHVETIAVAEDAPRGTVPGLDAWQASAGGILGRPVRSVSEFRIDRQWQNPAS